MKKLLPIFAATGVIGSLISAIYLGQINDFNFAQVIVKFCPQTANKKLPNGEKAQATLDFKYCRYRRRLLKEIWESEQFKAIIPLPEGSFSIQEFRGDKSGSIYLLLAPVLAGSAYLSWSDKCRKDYDEKFKQLEGIKTYFKLITVSARNEREFKSTAINQSWDTQRVRAGQISIDAVQDRLRKQGEIQDRSHSSTVKQFDLNDSSIDKTIAENQLAVAEANKKLDKLSGAKQDGETTSHNSPDEQLKNALVNALKNHENGWLWNIIDNQTPLWLIGRQGSAKTWTACTFALVRKYCLGIPIRHLIDEHAKGVNSQIWKYLEPQTTTSDVEYIGEIFNSITENWKLRIEGKNELEQPAKISPEQVIVDEYTALKSEVGEPADRFYRRHLKDTRKAKSYVVGVTHNDTNSSYPEGTKEQREAGTILIQKFSSNGKAPLPRIKIVRGLFDDSGNELLDFEAMIPSWFYPEKIYQHFNGKPINFND